NQFDETPPAAFRATLSITCSCALAGTILVMYACSRLSSRTAVSLAFADILGSGCLRGFSWGLLSLLQPGCCISMDFRKLAFSAPMNLVMPILGAPCGKVAIGLRRVFLANPGLRSLRCSTGWAPPDLLSAAATPWRHAF